MSRFRFSMANARMSVTQLTVRYPVIALRISLGVIFVWFGVLKFVSVSPAQELAMKTITMLTFGSIPDGLAITLLATWESLVGVGLVLGFMMRTILLLCLGHLLIATISPMVFFPDDVFRSSPLTLTLEGQYLLKNLVLISASVVVGTVPYGRVSPAPEGTRADL